MAAATQAWGERLRAQGYRITPQRQFVLEAVIDLPHATPEEILAWIQTRSPGVNLSTVYRALEVLEEVGLVTHAHLGHGAPTYHAVDGEVHVHLVCAGCHDVDSVPAQMAQGFVDALERDRGFATDIGHMTVQGLCRRCQEAGKPTRSRGVDRT